MARAGQGDGAGDGHHGRWAAEDDGQKPEDVNDCVQVRAEARYEGYGYSHIVHITNECKQTATCDVWTDVTPTHEHVTLKPGDKESIVTRRGSPARVFRIEKDCKPAKG